MHNLLEDPFCKTNLFVNIMKMSWMLILFIPGTTEV